MHEMSIATALLDQIERALEGREGALVREVELRIGAMQLVVPEALDLAWATLVQGTAYEGALLRQTEVPPRARCRLCGREFRPEIDAYVCPVCGKADVEILEGDSITLQSLLCDAPDESAVVDNGKD